MVIKSYPQGKNGPSDQYQCSRNARFSGADSAVQDRLENVEAREDLSQKLDEVFDLELLEEACCRVRLRVKPNTWEAFRLMHFDGLSGAAVADALNMKVAAVFVACSRVQKMLQEEIERLEHPPRSEKARA
jgi:RNA polymerase sigma-70 factor (ECF subfamily)